MAEVKSAGIVLNSMPIGDYDRRIELLTGDLGKITVFARGARKANSPFVAASRAMAAGSFTLYQGKDSYNLKQAEISACFEEISNDYILSCYGFYFLELTQYFAHENIESADLLILLYRSLQALASQRFNNKFIRSIFEIKIVQQNGLCPSPERVLADKLLFPEFKDIKKAVWQAFDYIYRSEAKNVFNFLIPEEYFNELASLSQKLIKNNTDKQFKTLSLLNDLL